MSPQADQRPKPLKTSQEVDSLCDRYECLWRAGQKPRLDDFLTTVDEALRPQAFAELLSLDAAYRADEGEAIAAETYLDRFPAFAETIQSFFAERSRHDTLSRAETYPPPDATLATLPTGRFGNYEILGEIARGGMGVVYKARQGGLDRLVAVKVIVSGPAATPAYIERFLAEARTAAGLQHPAIVSIVEVGQIEGLHFFSMEFLPGKTLGELVKDGSLTCEQAVRYARDIAEAIHFAHEHGVLHRDLKPSNVMVDSSGRVKVMDFGLAKLVEGPSQLTHAGELLGTPSYMSPEQASGDWPNVDRRTDIYALGAILYELLTGRPPHVGKSPMATMVQVIHETPPRPSEIKQDIDPRLEQIVLRCLEKDFAARYATAAELAAELDGFLNRDKEQAATADLPRSPPWSRRRRWLLGACGAAAAVLLGVVLIVRDRDGRIKAQFGLKQGDTLEIADNAAPQTGPAPKVNVGDVPKAAEPALAKPAALVIQPEPLQFDEGSAMSATALVARPAAIKGLQSWTVETRGHRSVVDAVAFRPDGAELVTGGRDGTMRIWQPTTGRLLRVLIAPAGVVAAAWSPDGRYLASGHGDGTARLWNVAEGRLLRTLSGHNAAVTAVGWSPDVRRLATGTAGNDKSVRIWNAVDGELLLSLAGHAQGVRQVAWSPEGRLVASADDGGTCRVCEAESGNLARTLSQSGAVRALAWSSDGGVLALAADAGVQLFNMTSEGKSEAANLQQPNVAALCWLADGKTLAAVGLEGDAQYWDTTESRALRSFQVEKSGGARFRVLALSPDGKHVAAVADNGSGTVQIVDARSGKQSLIAGHEIETPLWNYAAPPLAWSPHGNLIAYGSPNSEVAVWDAAAGELRRTLTGHFGPVVSVAWAAAGDTFASGGSDNTIRLWDTVHEKPLQVLTDGGWMSGLAWSPDAAQVATGGPGGTISLWKAADATRTGKLEGHKGPVVIAWSPDGKRMLSGSYDGSVRLWDVETAKLLKSFDVDQNEQKLGEIHCVSWSPDGKQFAAGGAGAVWFWKEDSEQVLASIKELPGWVYSLSWSPDGRSLAAGCGASALIWDNETHELKHTLAGRVGLVPGVSWSSDGRFLAASTLGSRSIQIWEAEAGRLDTMFVPLAGSQGLALTPQGHYRLTLPLAEGRDEGGKSLRNVAEQIVYVTHTDNGQDTLTPQEFAERFGWKNDPDQVRLRD